MLWLAPKARTLRRCRKYCKQGYEIAVVGESDAHARCRAVLHLQFRSEANERIGTVAADCFNGVADEVVENLTQLIGVASNFGKIAVAVQLNFSACTVVEVDDFGKEKSTLPMLKLPFVDTVKLDKSLIDCIGDRKGEIMLRQVVRLCYELGLYTTAEGVEAEDQVDFLRALDCTDIQGYFFSPTLPVEKYTEKLRAQGQKRT